MMKNQFGFSMIEIMITVAIIGIGATMAAPNYSLMVSKSRQSEARSELSQIYMREKAYFSEFGRYTGCLWQAGYNPPEGGKRFYTTGYNIGSTNMMFNYGGMPEPQPATIPVPPAQTCACGIGPSWGGASRNDCTFQANSAGNPSMLNAGLATPFVAEKAFFNAGAWGSISNSRVLDVWQINENKVVTQLQGGL